MNKIDKIQDEIIKEFSIFDQNEEEVLEYLMEIADEMPKLEEVHKIEQNKIHGCLSSVWIKCEQNFDKTYIYGDSNTKITKGLLSLLVRIYSGQKSKDILSSKLYYLDKSGLNKMLVSQRLIGYQNMVQHIHNQVKRHVNTKKGKDKITKGQVIEVIKQVYDPEIPVDVYALGLIYKISVDKNNNVHVLMTLTSPNCPAAETIPKEIHDNIKELKNVGEVTIEITFEPPYDTNMMSEEAKLELGIE